MDDRSSSAKAMAWVTRITTVSFMMVLPALGGYYLDVQVGTTPLFMFLGVVLGLIAGIWQLVRMIQVEEENEAADDRK